MLRQEVYALDGTDEEPHPYTVTEQNFTIRLCSRTAATACGLLHARRGSPSAITTSAIPPILAYRHALTLEVDEFGNVLKSAAVGLWPPPGRSRSAARRPGEASRLHITYTENRVTNAVDAGRLSHAAPCESRTYELTGLAARAPGRQRFTLR